MVSKPGTRDEMATVDSAMSGFFRSALRTRLRLVFSLLVEGSG